MTYPEHDRLAEVMDSSQAIGEFLEAENGYVLAHYVPCEEWHEQIEFAKDCGRSHLMPVSKSINVILAEHFGINLNMIEIEKRAMLRRLQEPFVDITTDPTLGDLEDVVMPGDEDLSESGYDGPMRADLPIGHPGRIHR